MLHFLTVEKEIVFMATKRVLRMGFVGVGPRARSLMKKAVHIPGVKIVGIYDPKQSAVEKTFEVCEQIGVDPAPKLYESSDALFNDKKIDAVIIAASWAAHVPLACAAMEAGKIVGLEVGPAMCIEDCFKLVEVQERTQAPFMFLENGCFKRGVLHALSMVKVGLFGEMIHASGGYQHCVSHIVYKEYKALDSGEPGNERILNRLSRNMEPYPTHEIGPIGKALNINRGNRMLTLTAMSTKAVGLKSYIKKTDGDAVAAKFEDLVQGDIVTTMIKCARGESICLTWNTSLPVPIAKNLKYYGTDGAFEGERKVVYVEGRTPKDPEHPDRKEWESVDNYKEFEHPGWKWYDEEDFDSKYGFSERNHSNQDFLMMYSFVECAKKGYTFPIDVYDAASWMAISVLAEESLANGSRPVFFPDFTNGKWMRRDGITIDPRFDCNA